MASETSEPDPDCHHDCFGDVRCEDGVVTVGGYGAVPCAWWTGSCDDDCPEGALCVAMNDATPGADPATTELCKPGVAWDFEWGLRCPH